MFSPCGFSQHLTGPVTPHEPVRPGCGIGRQARPLLSGWLILYRGGGGSEAKKKFVYLKSTSKFGPL